MSDQAAANLIFLPGFSTAASVTSVSGRGVGMDVVKTNIERIGGIVDLQFVAGQSTTLSARIPLTLAIIPALVVTCEENRYLIPQVNLVELLRLEADSDTRGIEYVGEAEVYRLRGRLLPIVHLREILGHTGPSTDVGNDVGADTDSGDDDGESPADAAADASAVGSVRNIVVLEADGRQFGLVVDGIQDTEEIVVKPLGPHLKSIEAFTGTTIMGDGAVALILDAIGIAGAANVLSEARDRVANVEIELDGHREGGTTAVIVCLVAGQRIAIPLALVDRLEEFSTSAVESTGGSEVVQYRGRLLRLVFLNQTLTSQTFANNADSGSDGDTDGETAPLQVLVYSRDDRVYGLVVDQIIDIIDADLAAPEESANEFVEFAAVIGRRVSDLLQIDEIIAAHESRRAEQLTPARG
jgi:two-component system chemotaxis sensor kinase CheA